MSKVAVVTGASAGIGLATAKLLVKKGYKVALVARNKRKLEDISKELPESVMVVADLSKVPEVERAFKEIRDKFGRVDVLVNNAGVGYDAPIEKIDHKDFHYLFDLNVVAPLVGMQKVIPLMRKQGEGSIVNISSGTSLMALKDMAAYSSLKRALVGLSLTAREELGDDGIKVSVVYPYATETDFEKNTLRAPGLDRHYDLKGDSPEYVAEKIWQAIDTGAAEVFAHSWMKKR